MVSQKPYRFYGAQLPLGAVLWFAPDTRWCVGLLFGKFYTMFNSDLSNVLQRRQTVRWVNVTKGILNCFCRSWCMQRRADHAGVKRVWGLH